MIEGCGRGTFVGLFNVFFFLGISMDDKLPIFAKTSKSYCKFPSVFGISVLCSFLSMIICQP